MNTIRIYLAESGSVSDLKKDFLLYQGQFQNKLLNVYVPTSILAPQFSEQTDGQTTSDYVAGTAVKIGMTYTDTSGKEKFSKNYYLRYLKTLIYQNVEYAMYERMLPQEFTYYAGQGNNAPTLIINVVNVKVATETDPATVISVITSQECNLDVMPSSYLDKDAELEADDLEEINARLNTIDANLANKQDKDDNSLETTNKTVVGAINELKSGVDTNTADIAKNTKNIAANTDDINELKQTIGTGEEYIGTLQWDSTTLPTDEQLENYVQETAKRPSKNGDVVIVIQELAGQTDKNYKYIKAVSQWTHYEIPPLEKASNGTYGLIEGTYNIAPNNDMLVNISGGQILDIYIRESGARYTSIQTLIKGNKTSIENIINGTTSVGVALKALADSLGNNIVDTYLTKTTGATKAFVYDYALPREFNDIFYISKDGYAKDAPTDTTPQFTVTTNNIGDFTLFDLTKTNDCEYELSRKNTANNSIYISANRDCTVTFRLTTQAKQTGKDYVDLDVELTTPISLKSGQLQRVDFSNVFTYLGDTVLKMAINDKIRQILEVVTTEIEETTFSVYSNETYPSTFNLNTFSQVVYHSTGKLGEQPTFTLTANGEITSAGVSLKGDDTAQIYNNVECQVIINIPTDTQGYASFNENMSIVSAELGGLPIRFATPYNFSSGTPTFKQLSQVPHTQDAVNGITYTMKCFISISEAGNITFIVDEDNLDDYADKDYVDLAVPKELFMGADGVEETQVYNFTVQNPETFLDYRTNKTQFLLDLHLPVVGALNLTKPVAITFGDTVYYLYNILKGNEHATIGDLKQVDKYNNATGYRFIFRATFFQNSDITGFAIIPTISMSDILSLTTDEMDAYMTDGGLTDGQIALCSTLGTNGGYELGELYKFVVTYPATYSWVKMAHTNVELTVPASATNGTLTAAQFAILKANDTNGIIFDHEYYKLSAKGHVEGYRTYYTVERENGSTTIKTITITESTLAWVLFDLDVEQKPVDETYTVASAMWRDLSGNTPYKYMASVTATYTIGDKTEVGIINDQPVAFANYGFVVGSISNQTVIIFAIDKPTAEINLSVRYRG